MTSNKVRGKRQRNVALIRLSCRELCESATINWAVYAYLGANQRTFESEIGFPGDKIGWEHEHALGRHA